MAEQKYSVSQNAAYKSYKFDPIAGKLIREDYDGNVEEIDVEILPVDKEDAE